MEFRIGRDMDSHQNAIQAQETLDVVENIMM